MLICGIDEAGRGPILGPLVMCGILIKEEDEAKLKAIKVKDSKLLTKEKREELYDVIRSISRKYHITKTDPEEIDNAVNGKDNMNLNVLEAKKTADILNKLKPDKAIINRFTKNIYSDF